MDNFFMLLLIVALILIWFFIKRRPNKKHRNVAIIVAILSFCAFGLTHNEKDDTNFNKTSTTKKVALKKDKQSSSSNSSHQSSIKKTVHKNKKTEKKVDSKKKPTSTKHKKHKSTLKHKKKKSNTSQQSKINKKAMNIYKDIGGDEEYPLFGHLKVNLNSKNKVTGVMIWADESLSNASQQEVRHYFAAGAQIGNRLLNSDTGKVPFIQLYAGSKEIARSQYTNNSQMKDLR